MRKTAAVIFILLACLNHSEAGQDKKAGESMDSPFGVLEFLHWNHGWNNYKYPDQESLDRATALMKEAGVSWVRQDFLWQEIEPGKGEFDFEKYDRIVEALSRNGINILGLLNYSAPWASVSGAWNEPPQDNAMFVNYAMEAIKRYRGKIKYWEVWNEPDSRIYWLRQDGLKSYCALLKDVYFAAKKVYPECVILNGGLANGIASVNDLYDNGAGGYFDILNIHIFHQPLDSNAIKRVAVYPKLAHKVMSRHGDASKKIWVTEIGAPGLPEGRYANNWWLGENTDEAAQAAWLKNVFKTLLSDKNVEKVFWAFFRDCDGHWNDGVDYFGMIRWDYSIKPSFKAYQEAISDWQKNK